MKKATISQTKNQLSALLDQVRHGETVLIMDRNIPIAKLIPAGSSARDGEGRLSRLERSGLLRLGTGKRVQSILRKPAPQARAGGDILRALLTEREESR